MKTTPNPFLRYCGGKRKLADLIIGQMPSTVAFHYYEPMLGGGAVFLALAALKRFERATLGDINHEIIAAWKAVAITPSELIEVLREWAPGAGDREFYNRMRRNRYTTPLESGARTIFLNQTSFNGLWRVNAAGEYNVPHGGPEKHGRLNQAYFGNLMRVHEVLQGVEINLADYRVTTAKATTLNDVVYLDPPYIPLSDTASFTSFNSGDFGPKEQIELADHAKMLASCGATVIISNHDVPEARALYAPFQRITIPVRRSMAADGSKRKQVNEVLMVARTWMGQDDYLLAE